MQRISKRITRYLVAAHYQKFLSLLREFTTSDPASLAFHSRENISMEDRTNCSNHGANWTGENKFARKTSVEYILPSDLTEISHSSLLGVFAYCIVLVIAVFGHLLAFRSLWRQYKMKKARIYLLLLHLSLADMIVCFVIVPTEIFWRLIVQWEGGNFLCKTTQFLRAFGLYLSSLVLICLSVDRFISIIFPLKSIGVEAYRRIKWMLAMAWIAAVVFSSPQTILFNVEYHPKYSRYKQCVTSAFHDEENFENVKIYSIFTLVIMYFIPLAVIAITYTVIFLKLAIKSHERSGSSVVSTDVESSVCTVVNESVTDRIKPTLRLRRSTNAQLNLSRAKMRTLLMTIVMVLAFIVCWTPYAIMTLWYMVDWEEAEKVDPRIQDALFLMVISNSCINPLIYGGFSRRTWIGRRMLCSFFL